MSSFQHQRPPIPADDVLATLPPDGGSDWNRLVFEKSPYLLQHAANPVDWWPWCDEAFEEARRRDLPVFLSIGYATCHWCHVMERESFESEEIGGLMNENFVCIKVDREERPDVDNVYMTVTQALTGSGGWPMTVLLTPERKPFFAGTYLPAEARYNRPGMREFVPHIGKLWREDRSRLLESANMITNELRKIVETVPGDFPTEEILATNLRVFSNRFDARHGGFGNRPKFPVPHNYMFLLREAAAGRSEDALTMTERSLTALRLGGIYDQVGFGFHRYSTDERWLLPHFEKMLYDQALLMIAYADAFASTGKLAYAAVILEIAEYLDRDMSASGGGFFSAEDADSEGVEGKFYVYASGELESVLGASDAAVFEEVFHFEKEGNFLEESTGEETGLNIPHLRRPLEEVAAAKGLDPVRFAEQIDGLRKKVLAYRSKRIRPLRDEKILTDWNGLMIAGLARAGAALGNATLIERGAQAATYFLTEMRDDRGRLAKRALNGKSGLTGLLEDYAFLAWGLFELHQATLDSRWLNECTALISVMREDFEDVQFGGFFQTPHDGEALIMRMKSQEDGAIPSGNSVAAYVLARVGRLLGDESLEEAARRTIEAFSPTLHSQPGNASMMLQAVQFLLASSTELVLVGPRSQVIDGGFLDALRIGFHPNRLVVHYEDEAIAGPDVPEYRRGMRAIDGRLTAYLCRNHACEAPMTDINALRSALKSTR